MKKRWSFLKVFSVLFLFIAVFIYGNASAYREGSYDRRYENHRRIDPTRHHYHRDFQPARRYPGLDAKRYQFMDSYVNRERLRTWNRRHHEHFRSYISYRHTAYNDWINPYFMTWLKHNRDYFHLWVYHHRFEIDRNRYDALLRENRYLSQRLYEMEQMYIAPNPNYCPPGIDQDMMYRREYLEQFPGS